MEENIGTSPTDEDIKEWSEGNEHLENLLIACRENGIPSMFCCAGHNDEKPAYIVFKLNNQTITRVYSIVNCLNNTNSVSIVFSQNPIFRDSKFSVYMYDETEKNSIMDSIANAIYKDEELESLPRNSQILLELAQLLISNKFNFDLTYYLGEEKEIYFRNIILEDTNYSFKRELKKLGFNSKQNGLSNKYFIKHISDKNEQEVLERILKGMKKICPEFNKEFVRNGNNEYDERVMFQRMISKNGELKKMSNTITAEKDNIFMEETIERNLDNR